MELRRSLLILAAGIVALGVAACGPAAPSAAPSASPTAAASPTSVPSLVTNAPTPDPSPTPSASPTPSPAPSPTATASPGPKATRTPAPTAAASLADRFWARVERGIRDAGRLEVGFVAPGPATGSLRYEASASATVIEGVVGYVCVGGRAYDGLSGFARVPGRWTCGAPALGAGFRTIGQPLDAWNATLPTDRGIRETVSIDGTTWTWRYRATSPSYGGTVTASVTLDEATGRITSARRDDPIGTTRYSFDYAAGFPRIVVPD